MLMLINARHHSYVHSELKTQIDSVQDQDDGKIVFCR